MAYQSLFWNRIITSGDVPKDGASQAVSMAGANRARVTVDFVSVDSAAGPVKILLQTTDNPEKKWEVGGTAWDGVPSVVSTATVHTVIAGYVRLWIDNGMTAGAAVLNADINTSLG